MKFLKNLHVTAEFFFLLMGSAYLLSLLLWRNNILTFETEMYMRLADVPFALVCIVFACTSIKFTVVRHYVEEDEEYTGTPTLDAILIALGFVLFLAIIFFNFAFKDLF